MEYPPVKCPPPTNANARWPYQQYYIGQKDHEERRNGQGENHWTGAESLEWYEGKFVRDTMHGEGDYRWRYQGPEGLFITYEGNFYGNCMHGYGTLSYPDGKVFKGLFYNNMRWGPGIETNTHLNENVGMWRGNQLVRLTWRPKAPSVTLDFNFGAVPLRTAVESHRKLFTARNRELGQVNSAIELLKQNGAEPLIASVKWNKLYPKYCNDLASRLCHVDLFEHEYYKNRIVELEEVNCMPDGVPDDTRGDESIQETYYAWNNSEMMCNMMKHCFKHDQQRKKSGVNLANVLSGLRTNFKQAGKHEYDCRNLIMSSYLGYIHKVAQLINQDNVYPDVADILGNTALMYAVCGNQVEIIHFLIEAGANVNNYNDSCCTPLALALIRFACLSKDIPPISIIPSLTPPPQPFTLPVSPTPSEWFITREMSNPVEGTPLSKTGSKSKLVALQKSKTSATTIPANRKVTSTDDNKRKKISLDLADSLKFEEKKTIPEEKLFNEIHSEFLLQTQDVFFVLGKPNTASIPYLFEVPDIPVELDGGKEDNKNQDKNKHPAHVVKNITKPSQDLLHSPERASLTSADKAKNEMLEKAMSTIVQLVSDGADPRLVRCPQPALRIALVSGSADLVRLLVQNGANINEEYPEAHSYTILDLAVLGPLTYNNLALIQTILDCGGTADHRLRMHDPEVPGPTLLHVVLAKHVEDGVENEVCQQIIELLLEYNANPLEQFKGSSAVECAMGKSLTYLDIFVKNPKTDLNAIINENNQTVLVKMFALDFFKNNLIDERLQILSNLLLYGADPLVQCQNGEETYVNLFVFAKQNIESIERPKPAHTTGTKTKSDTKMGRKISAEKGRPGKEKTDNIKIKKEESKSTKAGLEEIEDYRQAVNLVKDCVRILHVRWIQAKLVKELLGVVEKYEHRQWNMILPEHKNKRACGMWLSMPRCLEIWDILKTRRPKKVLDRRVLKHMLSLVHFYCNRVKTDGKKCFKLPVTADEKDAIDHNVNCSIQEHKAALVTQSIMQLSRPYVKPELARGAESKFQICFECCLPLPEDRVQCTFCRQVSFCSLECMGKNILEQNAGLHPCSEDLKYKYFPSTSSSIVQS